MGRGMAKHERLQEMERLYFQRAYSDIEMAQRLGVNRATVYRDRIELQGQALFVKDENGRWKIDRARYLSSIRLNLNEALALYLAARRASQQTKIAHIHTVSALEKLALALRQPMTGKLVKAAEAILSKNLQPERTRVMEIIARGWVEAIKVRITHRSLLGTKAFNYLLSPYLIEPSLWSDGTYVIGHSDVHSGIATFKVERIEKAVLTTETFTIPEDFDETALLQYAWGIWYTDEEPVMVKLRFSAGIATRRMKESVWHPLENVTDTEDGGCIWEAPVAEWQEMLPWIRGWGSDVEVLEPRELRLEMMREVKRSVRLYQIETIPSDGDDYDDQRLASLLQR